MVLTCDEKRVTLRRKEGDENESTSTKEERKTYEKMIGDIKEKGMWGRKCTTELHGGVCHRTSTPPTSGN